MFPWEKNITIKAFITFSFMLSKLCIYICNKYFFLALFSKKKSHCTCQGVFILFWINESSVPRKNKTTMRIFEFRVIHPVHLSDTNNKYSKEILISFWKNEFSVFQKNKKLLLFFFKFTIIHSINLWWYKNRYSKGLFISFWINEFSVFHKNKISVNVPSFRIKTFNKSMVMQTIYIQKIYAFICD